MTIRTLLLASLMALAPISAIGQMLPEIARTHDGVATSVIDMDAPISSPCDVMTLSDLVVNGVVTAVKTRLNADQSEVLTEYTVALKQVLKQRHPDAFTSPGLSVTTIVV